LPGSTCLPERRLRPGQRSVSLPRPYPGARGQRNDLVRTKCPIVTFRGPLGSLRLRAASRRSSAVIVRERSKQQRLGQDSGVIRPPALLPPREASLCAVMAITGICAVLRSSTQKLQGIGRAHPVEKVHQYHARPPCARAIRSQNAASGAESQPHPNEIV